MDESDEATGAELLIEALRDVGVTHVFANFGSDHPGIIEALAREREGGERVPRVVLCPHEHSALSAAHGYAAVTGEAQAVFVHTDVGTANLGGAVHNAARSRVPVFVFAGLTPYTLEGEAPGTRNSHINHLQDAPDQHALVRQYVKWTYDVRTAANVPQLVHRAMQIARSAPAGPVYVTAAREVLAQTARRPRVDGWRWGGVAPAPAPEEFVDELITSFSRAAAPLVITSYLGRNRRSVARLVDVAERLGAAVVEVNAEVLSFPHDHPLHLGDDPHGLIEAADVILAIDTDVPWLESAASPRSDAHVYVVNEDPLQERIPLWYVPADRFIRADSGVLLDQILSHAPARGTPGAVRRADAVRERSRALRAAWTAEADRHVADGRLTASSVARVLSSFIDDEVIVVNETISAASAVWRSLPRRRPGTLYGNRGTSLGWSGGGALGIKLASPERTVVSIVGDGTFFFSVPSSTYWIAQNYGLPVLTIVLDNGGWNATKRNHGRQYAHGAAERTDRYWVSLQQSADYGGIAAAAGGAHSATVALFSELEPALRNGLAQVESGTPAVVTVRLEPITRERPEAALTPP